MEFPARSAMTRRDGWVCLALVGIVALLYGQVLHHEFVLLDDHEYIVENPYVSEGLTWSGARWAFGSSHAGNWHPLTWLSHMADSSLFGLDAGRHHLVNVALHAANAVLLLLALRALTAAFWPSAFVATLFAVHPLRVESVAWVAERKELLAALFWMLATLAYTAYARRAGPGRYLLVLLLLALGLMSKPTLVTLPFVLLLLDVWPLGRWRPKAAPRLILEKLPMLALSSAACIVTVVAQRADRAVSTLDAASWAVRLANALVAYATYLWKTLWPTRLAVFYPHPELVHEDALSALVLPAAGSALFLSAVTLLALGNVKRRSYLAVGWFWFLGSLVPMIGIVQVGVQSMADRYSYLPLIGIYIMVVWGAAELTQQGRGRALLVAVTPVVLAAYAAATFLQVGTWSNSRTLYEHAARVTRDNCVIHKNLGNMYLTQSDPSSAAREFERALRLEPEFPEAHSGLGDALVHQGDLTGAMPHYEQAVRLNPSYSEAHHNLAVVYAIRGRLAEAIVHYKQALHLDPLFAEAHNNLGLALETGGDLAAAAQHYEQAIGIQPDYSEPRDNLERVKARLSGGD